MFVLEEAVRPNILKLKPYRCARDDYSNGILLDANENSHGPSIVKDEFGIFKQLERYPDPYQIEIKRQLCSLRSLSSTEHFFLGVGSDECIDMTMRVFVQPGKEKILITPPTYGMYSVCAQINDVEVVTVPLVVENGEFQLHVPNILNALEQDPSIKVVYLCSPGNPTGTLLKHDDIRSILRSNYKGIVVVDEAYIDFCDDGATVSTWVTEFPNLVVSQTLSKAFGLASIRLGFTISSKEIAQIFNNTKAPYNISTPTSTLAQNALSSSGVQLMKRYIASIKLQRDFVLKELEKLPFVGGFLGTHDANFILAQIVNKNGVPCNEAAFKIYKTLAEKEGVVVRYRGNELGCQGCLRITIGTKEENQVLLHKLSIIQ